MKKINQISQLGSQGDGRFFKYIKIQCIFEHKSLTNLYTERPACTFVNQRISNLTLIEGKNKFFAKSDFAEILAAKK